MWSFLDRRRDLRHVLPQARSERAVVGLRAIGDQLRLALDEVELLDVELGGDDLGEPLDRNAFCVGGDDHRLAQRLAELDLGLGAGGATELDRAADRFHAGLELRVD